MAAKAPEGAPEAYYQPIPGEGGEEEHEEYSMPENPTANDYIAYPYK